MWGEVCLHLLGDAVHDANKLKESNGSASTSGNINALMRNAGQDIYHHTLLMIFGVSTVSVGLITLRT